MGASEIVEDCRFRGEVGDMDTAFDRLNPDSDAAPIAAAARVPGP
jgi:hypothetical protein